MIKIRQSVVLARNSTNTSGDSFRAVAVPGLIAGSAGRTTRIGNAFRAVGSFPTRIAETFVGVALRVDAESVVHVASLSTDRTVAKRSRPAFITNTLQRIVLATTVLASG